MSGLACAERLIRRCERAVVHAKKEKRGCDVCGAATSPLRESVGTRQKRKVSLWRVRSTHFVRKRECWYTSERKSKVATCAEHTFCQCKRILVHARREKQGRDVCGAHILSVQENVGTRQKGKTI